MEQAIYTIVGLIATASLTGASVYFSNKYTQVKKFAKTVMAAAEDNNITAEEVQEVVKHGKTLLD